MVTSATVGGQHSAQLMMVVGTDAGGNLHPNWQENLSLALKLTVLLEQENPGICRPINLRSERFNMDLTHGSLLVEVGAAGNTREEALIAANALAQAVLALSQGANLS
jgi:stage II sporulation protein P